VFGVNNRGVVSFLDNIDNSDKMKGCGDIMMIGDESMTGQRDGHWLHICYLSCSNNCWLL